MKTSETLSILFASLLFVGTATAVVAQTDSQDHDAHHPPETQAAPAAPTADAPASAAMRDGMPGMGMMPPEMMQMMQRMMGQEGMAGMMRGRQGRAMPEGGMGPGMMGGMPLGDGMMACPMMPAAGERPMGAMMGGAAMLYGLGTAAQEEMTAERVRVLLEERIAWHGNPRLEVGEIAEADDGSIVAEIVTVDGSLVQRLAFNRYPGLVRMLAE